MGLTKIDYVENIIKTYIFVYIYTTVELRNLLHLKITVECVNYQARQAIKREDLQKVCKSNFSSVDMDFHTS